MYNESLRGLNIKSRILLKIITEHIEDMRECVATLSECYNVSVPVYDNTCLRDKLYIEAALWEEFGEDAPYEPLEAFLDLLVCLRYKLDIFEGCLM